MKAVILETKDGYCAVLKDDGTVEKIKMPGEVGQEITMPTVRADIRRFPIRRVAAAAVALVAIASGVMSQMQEYSYVSVDVDASVEYSLNRMDRVISVKALNKKGEELAESVRKEGVQGASLDKAVEKTATVLQEQGYVDSDEGVLMSVSSKSEKKSQLLAEKVESALDNDDVSSAVEKVSMADRKDAQDNGLSAGRYAVTKGIVGSDSLDEAAIDAARKTSTSDLIQLAEEIDISSDEDAVQADTDAKEDGETKAKKDKDDKDTTDDAELCEEIHEDDADDEAQQVEEEELAPPLAPLEEATDALVTEETTEQTKSEEASKAIAPASEENGESQAVSAEGQEDATESEEGADTEDTKVSESTTRTGDVDTKSTESTTKTQSAAGATTKEGASAKPSTKSGSKTTTKTDSTKVNKKTNSSKPE